jgi:hypothetical protein
VTDLADGKGYQQHLFIAGSLYKIPPGIIYKPSQWAKTSNNQHPSHTDKSDGKAPVDSDWFETRKLETAMFITISSYLPYGSMEPIFILNGKLVAMPFISYSETEEFAKITIGPL